MGLAFQIILRLADSPSEILLALAGHRYSRPFWRKYFQLSLRLSQRVDQRSRRPAYHISPVIKEKEKKKDIRQRCTRRSIDVIRRKRRKKLFYFLPKTRYAILLLLESNSRGTEKFSTRIEYWRSPRNISLRRIDQLMKN